MYSEIWPEEKQIEMLRQRCRKKYNSCSAAPRLSQSTPLFTEY